VNWANPENAAALSNLVAALAKRYDFEYVEAWVPTQGDAENTVRMTERAVTRTDDGDDDTTRRRRRRRCARRRRVQVASLACIAHVTLVDDVFTFGRRQCLYRCERPQSSRARRALVVDAALIDATPLARITHAAALARSLTLARSHARAHS